MQDRLTGVAPCAIIGLVRPSFNDARLAPLYQVPLSAVGVTARLGFSEHRWVTKSNFD